jgi:hypothetical protein
MVMEGILETQTVPTFYVKLVLTLKKFRALSKHTITTRNKMSHKEFSSFTRPHWIGLYASHLPLGEPQIWHFSVDLHSVPELPKRFN